MNAADIMTSAVVTVNADATVLDAGHAMLAHRVSGLPVVDWQGRVVGMLTEGDLLHRAETGTERHRSRWVELLVGPGRMAQEYTLTHARKVSEVMTSRVVAIVPDTALDQVVALMERHHVKRLPVVENQRLLGIVARADLLRALVDKTNAAPPPANATDREIHDRIVAELTRQSWAPRAIIRIEVKDGIVALGGTITDERERIALRVAAENVAGVKSVVDRLVWVEPLSGMVIEPPEEAPKKA
jgi:CBS-domain-containing membrane protein